MPTNPGPTNDSDASTPRRLPGETFASTLGQGLLAELDSRTQLPKQEAEETHPATSDTSEVLVQVGSDQGWDLTFLDHERLNNNAGFQVDPMLTTTTRNDNNNKATDYSPRAGVTEDYPCMARNERILSYPMLDLTQSRHKQQILQDPSTAPLVSPPLARATVKLVPLSSSSSHLLARRRGAAVAATTEASHGSGNPPAALFELASSGALPRPGIPFSIAGTASPLGANAAHESDSYFPMGPVRASLGLAGTGDLNTAAPAPLPMLTRYPRPPSWYLNLPLRLAQLLRPDFFPQRAYWSDYAYRRRRASLLSCVLFAEEEEEDQGQVSPSSSDEVTEEDGSEFEMDSEASVIDDQSLTLFPVLSYLEADDVASSRCAVEKLDLSNGNEPLDVVDSMDGPGSAVSLTDVAQGSIKDNSSNGTPASHSIPEKWPPTEMRNLTVNFLFDIQPASPLTDAFPPLNPQADGFPTAVNDGLEPETAAAPLDQNLQALLDFLNTPARPPLYSSLVIQEVENTMTSIDATLPAHESECHQSNLTELEGKEGKEGKEERGSQSVWPWMKHKTIRADLDLLKFTADYSVAVKVRDDFVETSSRLREQQLRHLIYMHQAIDGDVRKEEKQDKEEKEEKLEKEEEGECPVGDCEDLLEDLTVSSLAQSWLDDDSETVTPGSRIGGSGSSTPVVTAGEEMRMKKKEERDEFTAKLDVVFSQLGGLLAPPPRLARKEGLLQGDFAHEDSHERVPEGAGKSSLIVENLAFVVDDEMGDSHESLVLGSKSAYDSDDGEDEDAFVDASEEDYSQHPNVVHRLFHSHPHLRDLYPPEIPQTVNLPKRPSYILDEQGQIQILAPDAPLPDLSTWTFQPGPHHTPVVNNKVVVTCENCLGQFGISPDNLDVLERHQAESCRTPLQQRWQRFLLVAEKMTSRGKVWDTVRRRSRRGVYRLSSQTINWMMDALLGQLQLVQAFVDEDAFDADAGRLVEKEEEEIVREVVQGSGY
ncbi:hypothetical protein KI688_005319 [Linnemannia hyalina]|uniref:Uncharacterized protein n=1 Tax=Linnemannia hyalina TaxID=64524 RepID=A0A9P7XKT1_9FUNG|nr:hypothetical protein KI688_005319 [Linnemannia hyalina]